jgi:hypothetical protein
MKTPIQRYTYRHLTIALVILQLSLWQSANAQQGTHTYILNKQRQPLAYTNTGKGTMTDEQGRFDHRIFSSGDSLAITNIAYQKVLLTANQLKDTIYLLPVEKKLPNLNIYNWSAFNKNGSAGYSKRTAAIHYGLLPGGQYAIFIEGKTGVPCWIQSVNLKFQSTGNCNGKIRIRLLSKHPENGQPGEDLIDETEIFLISSISKNWTVNFKDQHLVIPEEGMYVVIDVLSAEDACMPKGESYGIEGLSLFAAVAHRPDAGWRSFRDGRWYPLRGFGTAPMLVPQVAVQYKHR